MLSCSGSTACFYLSSLADSDASWPRYAVVPQKKGARGVDLPPSLPDKLQKPASIHNVWQVFWKLPRKDLSCTTLRGACVSIDLIGSRMPARISRPWHHGPRRTEPRPHDKTDTASFRWGSPSGPTLTPVEASPSSLTTGSTKRRTVPLQRAAQRSRRVESSPRSATSVSVPSQGQDPTRPTKRWQA